MPAFHGPGVSKAWYFMGLARSNMGAKLDSWCIVSTAGQDAGTCFLKLFDKITLSTVFSGLKKGNFTR